MWKTYLQLSCVLLFILLLPVSVRGEVTNTKSIEHKISSLKTALGSERERLANELILSIESLSDSVQQTQYLSHIVSIAELLRDTKLYYRYRLYLARYQGDTGQKERIAIIQATSGSDQYVFYRGQACKEAANYFMKLELYDSVAIYLLMARDIFEPLHDTEELSGIYQTLGDLFYIGYLYDDAEKQYQKVLALYETNNSLPIWRKYVCLDNLALIELRRHNWYKAKAHFTKSLHWKLTYNAGKLTREDSIAVCYLYQELSIIAYRLKTDSEFESVWNKAIVIAVKMNLTTNIDVLYEIRGIFLYDHGQYDSAKYYLAKSIEINKRNIPRMVSGETYQYLAQVYSKMGDYKNAWLIQRDYTVIADSLNAGMLRGKFLGKLFLHEYKKYEKHVSQLNKEKYTLYALLFITLLLLLWVLVVLYKLRRANQYLVKKNLEVFRGDKIAANPHTLKQAPQPQDRVPIIDGYEAQLPSTQPENALDTDTEGINQESIIAALQSVMHNEKAYLDSKLTIEQLAKKINTNRYYLSRAINSVYNMNFSGYVNQYRINEAIRLFSLSEYQNYTLEGIANTVGFNTRASFIAAFQKQTGLLPSYFRKRLHSQQSESTGE